MVILFLALGIAIVNPGLEIEFGNGLDRQSDAGYGHRVDGRVGEIVSHQGKGAECSA
jgi:hypothetical protein